MTYTIVVAGPHGSGKSSLLAASIVHARRLATQDFELGWRAGPRRESSPRRSTGHAIPALAIKQADASLWQPHELDLLETPHQIDVLAQRLWNWWLKFELSPEPERTEGAFPGQPFSVTSIVPNLLGFGELRGPQPSIELVEVSGDLFHTFATSGVVAFASRRLRSVLHQAHAVIICVPCDGRWSDFVRMGVRQTVAAYREFGPQGGTTTLALTKADTVLAQYCLARHACTDPVEAASSEFAQEVLSADSVKESLWQSLRSTADISLQICSSYGLLRRSGTPNVDLAGGPPDARRAQRNTETAPLWPRPSQELGQIVPSAPATLGDWMPLGAIETVFNAVANPPPRRQ